ncbi:MAG: cupin domain-containing protein [Firmicutes bacterium HGW-Firmicutes-1]|jgi:quercetin dioxygenase-like cupin family protein|nr:MAG: cupin domain-containing protein [Firmicutes bacterium HGW-Firmicutes-1]
MKKLLKNIDFAKILEMEDLVTYNEGQVVSKTLVQNKTISITLFAFDQNEEIGEHVTSGDAMVYVLDGMTEITIGEELFKVKKGETIVMPAGIPHALFAREKFKMLLIIVFNPMED